MESVRHTLLIAAMGGEGGGVLSQWLSQVLEAAGYRVQYTAIPGVAQRTGATTYYMEFFPEKDIPPGKEPAFSLLPMPGNIDVAIATELAEIGRLINKGYISKRTLLIGSTHRHFATSEKMAMGDGRMFDEPVKNAAAKAAGQVCLLDFANLAQTAGAIINACVFGAFAKLNTYQLSADSLREVLLSGKAAATNLKAFELGYQKAALGFVEDVANEVSTREAGVIDEALADRIHETYPEHLSEFLLLCTSRVDEYQDSKYAELFLDRLRPLLQYDDSVDKQLIKETARQLTLWMCFNDLIRVAQLKLAPERRQQIREHHGLKSGQRLQVTEFFKPGLEELAAVLPPALGKKLLSFAAQKDRREKYALSLRLKSTGMFGQICLHTLASLRRWRRGMHRYQHEQENITRWLEQVYKLASTTPDAALAFVASARLLKGYGETWQRGERSFRIIEAALPAISARDNPAEIIGDLNAAALQDPEGDALEVRFNELNLNPN